MFKVDLLSGIENVEYGGCFVQRGLFLKKIKENTEKHSKKNNGKIG